MLSAIFLLLYLFGVTLLAFLFQKKLKTTEDFFLGSRHLSTGLIYFSLTASWIGATSTLVATDEAYRQGLSSLWIMALPTIITVIILALCLVRPLRKLNFISLPDLIEDRYGRLVRHLVSGLIIWYMVLLASSQLVAGGKFLAQVLGINYFTALLIITGVVIIYATLGGLFSVALTDTFQFFLIFGAISYLAISLYHHSWSSALPPLHFSRLTQNLNLLANFRQNILICLSFVLAWVISPISWQRIQAASTTRAAQQALWWSVPTFILYFGLIIFIGYQLKVLALPFNHSGPILSQIIQAPGPSSLRLLLFIGIIAAIMSTLDTAINTGALSLTQDVILQLVSPTSSAMILFSRASTIIMALLALAVAFKLQTILQALGLASEIMAEGLFLPGLAMLFLKKKYPRAGLLALLLGGGFALVGFLAQINLIPLKWLSWPQTLPLGVSLSALGFIIGLFLDSLNRHPSD